MREDGSAGGEEARELGRGSEKASGEHLGCATRWMTERHGQPNRPDHVTRFRWTCPKLKRMRECRPNANAQHLHSRLVPTPQRRETPSCHYDGPLTHHPSPPRDPIRHLLHAAEPTLGERPDLLVIRSVLGTASSLLGRTGRSAVERTSACVASVRSGRRRGGSDEWVCGASASSGGHQRCRLTEMSWLGWLMDRYYYHHAVDPCVALLGPGQITIDLWTHHVTCPHIASFALDQRPPPIPYTHHYLSIALDAPSDRTGTHHLDAVSSALPLVVSTARRACPPPSPARDRSSRGPSQHPLK